MPTLHAFVIYCTVYAIAVAVPGPGIVAIVARALGSGFRATIPAAIGTLLGDLVVMTLSVLGLALIAKALGTLFLAVKLGGALYLVYLGYRYWTAPVSEDPASVVNSAPDRSSIPLRVSLVPPDLEMTTVRVRARSRLSWRNCVTLWRATGTANPFSSTSRQLRPSRSIRWIAERLTHQLRCTRRPSATP